MRDDKANNEDKHSELLKYRDLVLATIDYYLDNKVMRIKTNDFDSDQHYEELKKQAEQHFQKGRLVKLKQWFRDLIEMQIETVDLQFNKYLQEKTNYDIDIFASYFQRIDKIIAKGSINSDSQFYDIHIMIDQLCQTEPIDQNKIEILNNLIADYEHRRSSKKRKPTA